MCRVAADDGESRSETRAELNAVSHSGLPPRSRHPSPCCSLTRRPFVNGAVLIIDGGQSAG